MMKKRLLPKFSIVLFLSLMMVSATAAQAATLSGNIQLTPEAGGGSVFVGVFDPEDPGPHNFVGSVVIPSGDVASTTPYSIDLIENPPGEVLVLAFYDRNNSCDPGDAVTDWPDYGDVIGYYPSSPVAVGTSDMTGIDFSISTTYEGTSGTTLYDDFSTASGLFDTAKWRDFWNVLEYVRRVEANTLRSGFRSSTNRERNRMQMSHAGAVTRLKADVLIEDIYSGSHPDNRVFARIETNLYNASSTAPDSQLGDIWSGLYVGKQADRVIAQLAVEECTSTDGSTWDTLFWEEIPVSEPLALNTWYTLEIVNPQDGSITFNILNGTTLIGSATKTGLSARMGDCQDSYPALITGMNRNTDKIELCRIFAKFDDAELNGTAYDDFDTGTLDPSLWRSTEMSRLVEDGSAVLMAESKGAVETNRLSFSRKVSHIYTDVTIDEDSFAQNGAKGRIRLEGNFYNDTHSGMSGDGYNGEEGQVWAQVYIDLYDDGTMAAKWYMEKALVAEPVNWDTDYQEIDSGIFEEVSVTKGKTYRLGINFAGTSMIFSCSELDSGSNPIVTAEPDEIPITTPAYPLEYEFAALTARVYQSSQPGKQGRITARFSQVNTGNPVDQDGDTLSDFDELRVLYNPGDGDMDGDGIMDANEDLNVNGRMDWNETSATRPDSDDDGVNDGTEIGLTAAQIPGDADEDFVADLDPASTTDPRFWDTDFDGLSDGQEDLNANGRVDAGESDPNKRTTLSGRVTDSSGSPIGGLWLHAFDNACGGNWLGGGRTDANGEYIMYLAFAGGPVYVEACSSCDGFNFTQEWWTGEGVPGSPDCSLAQDVNVGIDQQKENIDFVLDPAGWVTGTVTDNQGTPIEGMRVHARTGGCDGVWLGGVTTEADGTYVLTSLPEGEVYISTCSQCEGLNYIDTWYKAAGNTTDCSLAGPVTITGGAETPGIDFALFPGASVSGQIVDENGAAISGMWVHAHDNGCDFTNYLGGASTDDEGYYTLTGVPSGNVYIQTSANNNQLLYFDEYWAGTGVPGTIDCSGAVNLNLTLGEDRGGIDFQLEPSGGISGTVEDASGPVYNLHVYAVSDDPCSGPWVAGTNTDEQGNYFLTGVPQGTVYVQTCSSCNPENIPTHVNAFYNDVMECAQASPISVTTSQVSENINFLLETGETISGRIVEQGTTDGIANIHVFAIGGKCSGIQYTQTNTDENGYFTLPAVPTGKEVYLYVCPECNNENYIGEWFDGADGSRDCNGATAITVNIGSPVNLGDLAVEPGYTISGTVSGDNVEGIDISVHDSVSGEWLGGGRINPAGTYTIAGIPWPSSGTYRIYLNSGDSYYLWEAYPLAVSPDQTDVDFTPVKGARVYGQVSGEGAGLENICVLASKEECGSFEPVSGNTDADGNYSFIVPTAGVYLYAEADCNPSLGYYSRFWTSAGMTASCGSAEQLVLGEATDTLINFDLPRKTKIYGTIRESQTGDLRNDATVDILSADSSGLAYRAVTNSLGEYEVYVDPGNYMVMAYAPGLARTFYDGVYPSSEASLVLMQSEDPDKNIDFQLDVGGSISGTIYQGDGTTPIADAEIRIRPSQFFFDYGFSVRTDANGHYTVDCLALGLYKVTARADGFAELNYYSGNYGWENAENVLVQPPAETADIDISLDPEARISGYIKAGDTGQPLELGVIADPTIGSFEGIGGRADITDDGRYTIKGLPPDSYTIRVESDLGYYVGEFYNDAHERNGAGTVTVQAGDHVSGINFDLEQGGRICGSVVDDETGLPVRETQIGCQTMMGDGLPSAPMVDYDGYFSLNAIPGFYKLNVFHVHGYVNEYFEDAYTFDSADPVEVQSMTQTPCIEIRLNRGGSIEGFVYEKYTVPSLPLAGASLYAFPVDPDMPGAGTISNEDGSYKIEGLVTGKYVVKAVTNGYAMQCRETDVTMPETTSGVDLGLSPYPYSVVTKAEVVVSPSGGSISVGSGSSDFNFVGVQLPSGSLDEYSLISISELETEAAPMPPVVTGINIPIHLGPEGTQFNVPVNLQVAYTDQDLVDAGVSDPSELDVFTLNTDTFKWEKVLGNKVVDYGNELIEIELEHFSIYQLGRSVAPVGDFSLDGDVDGEDLVEYIQQITTGGSVVSLEDLAGNFGSAPE
jgi:hypothetical protein